jgi:dihydroflavonol-4-reductase
MFCSAQLLVTGATGFIGRHVARRLLQRGARLRLFCRSAPKARRLFGESAEVFAGDLTDDGRVAAACRGADVVIHLGALYQFGRPLRRQLDAVNRRGTETLLAAARAAGAARFVHVSSSGVLEGRGERLTEQDFPARVSRLEAYRRSKWLGERAALQAARDGFPVTIASPTSPLGAGDEAPTPTGRIVKDFLAGGFPFGARVAINYIHVDDLATGILAVAEHGRTGERYLLGHHNVWLTDLLRLIGHCAGRPAPEYRLPLALIGLAGAFGELAGSSRVCWETAAHARRRQWFDFRKSADQLGWQPVIPLERTVAEAVAWFARPDGTPPVETARELSSRDVAVP